MATDEVAAAQDPDAAPPAQIPPAPRPDAPTPDTPRSSLLRRELPYLIVLAMTLIGVAYTSAAREPLIVYWQVLALTVFAVCAFTGWRAAATREERLRMLWTQALHWGAFLVAMNIVLLPGVQRVLTSSATGLTLLMLLALGTFVAGIHLSLRVCLLGLAMALAVPAIAWLRQSALFLLLAAIALAAIAFAVWWIRAANRPIPRSGITRP